MASKSVVAEIVLSVTLIGLVCLGNHVGLNVLLSQKGVLGVFFLNIEGLRGIIYW